MPLTFMQMFDGPVLEPNCELRHTSTVAPQSLVLMNSPFMLRQSLSFAERVRRGGGSDVNKQIGRAWQLAFARAPKAEELAEAVAFLHARAAYFRAHPPAPVQRGILPGRNMMMMGAQRLDLLVDAAARADPELLALALLCQMLMSSNEFLYVS
jgi:hypothetical protein